MYSGYTIIIQNLEVKKKISQSIRRANKMVVDWWATIFDFEFSD
jgi:hypothetical protein